MNRNSTKSKTQLGWEPKYDIESLVKEMVSSDLKILKSASNAGWENVVE